MKSKEQLEKEIAKLQDDLNRKTKDKKFVRTKTGALERRKRLLDKIVREEK